MKESGSLLILVAIFKEIQVVKFRPKKVALQNVKSYAIPVSNKCWPKNADIGENTADLSDFFGYECYGAPLTEYRMPPRTCNVVFIDDFSIVRLSPSGLTFTRIHPGCENSSLSDYS